jgi:cell wall-associated NlpC family hydrolase
MMPVRMRRSTLLAIAAALILSACSSLSPPTPRSSQGTAEGNEVALYAMGLIGTGYHFGGKNPEAGLDCSGMVSYVFREAVGYKVSGSAADIARQGREIDKDDLQPGDLVFFDTQNRPFSHVGIYIGNGRFIHAPSSKGKVRIARMDNVYFAKRFEMARSFFN